VPEQNERQALEGHGGRVPDGPQYTLASVSLRIEGRFEAGHHLKPVFGKHLQVAAEWVKVISHEGDAALFGHDGDMGTRDGRKGMDIGKKHVAPRPHHAGELAYGRTHVGKMGKGERTNRGVMAVPRQRQRI
jgi:hypothetical protein